MLISLHDVRRQLPSSRENLNVVLKIFVLEIVSHLCRLLSAEFT